MNGTAYKMINTIIERRSSGNSSIASLTKVKLTVKGINPDNYTSSTPDDDIIIEKLKVIAQELKVTL